MSENVSSTSDFALNSTIAVLQQGAEIIKDTVDFLALNSTTFTSPTERNETDESNLGLIFGAAIGFALAATCFVSACCIYKTFKAVRERCCGPKVTMPQIDVETTNLIIEPNARIDHLLSTAINPNSSRALYSERNLSNNLIREISIPRPNDLALAGNSSEASLQFNTAARNELPRWALRGATGFDEIRTLDRSA